MDFSRISVGIKTFLRDEKLFYALGGIRINLPGAQIIVADDGEMTEEKDGVYAKLEREGHKVIRLPFDAGFGTKSNAIAGALSREFLLVGSDDFDFYPGDVARGIKEMESVLDRNPELSIVSGRLKGRGPYEFMLLESNGIVLEAPCKFDDWDYLPPVGICHLTVNYSLIRREVFDKVRHDDGVKIGDGDHGAFFLDVKHAGFKVGYIPGVFISHQGGSDSIRYSQFRRRANSPERSCFVKRGITKYVLGNGHVDYEKEKSQ